MKMIKDLGPQKPTPESNYKKGMAVYECERCHDHVTMIKADVKKRGTTRCKKCCTITHGQTIGGKKDILYQAWENMRARCYNLSYKDYARYGGRGITVCNKWKNDSVAFIEWAKANGHKKGLSLDRRDNDKNYSPSNCRWVTKKIQSQNTVHLRKSNTSGHRGIIKAGDGWKMQIHHDGKYHHGRKRQTKEGAAMDYDTFVVLNKTEHTLNFP